MKISMLMRSALALLANNYDLWVERGKPESERYTCPWKVHPNTLEALGRRGLADVSYRVHGYTMAQITDEGYKLVRGEERP